MRFSDQFLDDIRARLPVSHVVARKVALKKAGREFRGLSPFKVEKTPSFFVNDQKGFYHCFASGEHGDIFKFVMRMEGLTFPEAVERLAGEAGVPMPREPVRDEKREDERARLYAVMEAAATFFQKTLAAALGTEARHYLDRRGLKRETIARFRLGYAPNSKSALREHLAKAGFIVEEMISAGLLVSGEDIPVGYDRFRHRVMFPITDLKGRVIAFGGRALDLDQPAKYLNSPETPLFHKGAILFNAANARSPAHERGRVIAVEGYMDVIALTQAGFPECVAPLGTALTEDQARLLWRMAPEPILCFDGDGAGRKAAFRAVDTVLPHLEPGRSVKFALLNEGLDPDDFVRQHGAEAFSRVLNRALPLFDVLFEREEISGPLDTAEQLAGLQNRLLKCVKIIADASVRKYYTQELYENIYERTRRTLRGRTGATGRRDPRYAGSRRNNVRVSWQTEARRREKRLARVNPASQVAASDELSSKIESLPSREALLVSTVVNHPWLIEDHAEDVAVIPLTSPALAQLRDAILAVQTSGIALDRDALRSQLSEIGLGKVMNLVERVAVHGCDRFAKPEAERAEVEAGWRHTLALHVGQIGMRHSLDAAERAWHEDGSEDSFARIRELQGELARMSGADDLDPTTEVDPPG